MLASPNIEERFGDRSYAIISDKYLNFSSRVGYHYSVLDAYCGETVNKNYITFSFKGGAADDLRRNRRVRAIALVLNGLGFTVDVQATGWTLACRNTTGRSWSKNWTRSAVCSSSPARWTCSW